MPELSITLIRGLPGSGKSTLAKKLLLESELHESTAIHLETDMFFIDGSGDYRFQPKLLPEAHQWCQQQCALFLKEKQSVIISNTFVKQWEMKPYRELANQYKAQLVIKTCTGNYKSIHDVPETTIKKMKQQWQL